MTFEEAEKLCRSKNAEVSFREQLQEAFNAGYSRWNEQQFLWENYLVILVANEAG